MSNLPSVEFSNLFDIDVFGKKFWSYQLGETHFATLKEHFIQFGRSGALATPHSDLADKNGPVIHNFNKIGERVDHIAYHPSYLELQKLSYGQGIVSLKYDKKFLSQYKSIRHLTGFALGYYFAQTESGMYCPICMTDALGRVLEKHNQHPMAQKTLAHIASSNLEDLWQGAMFLTEKQGGSDVGANTCISEEIDGKWYLTGDKWFCSNADAKAILALARMPGAEGSLQKGTRGLGLFLVLRDEPKNNHQTWLTHRLKEKLGVRSMASGEISFNKTEAFLIGGAGEGFKMMTDMVNMSRIYNAVASLGIVRRSLAEALAYGNGRTAFDKKLSELPLWRACLADIAAEHISHMLLTFEAIHQLDLADTGNEEAAHLVRVMTPLAKGLSGKLAVFSASECMELVGGNAYIEEHILARLLRDAQVLPIWEGTTNIQSLDMLRVFLKEHPTALLKRCEEALKKASDAPTDLKKGVIERIQGLQSLFTEIKHYSPEDMQRVSRELLEKSGRALSLALALEATTDKNLKPIMEATIKRLLLRRYNTAPVGGNVAAALADTEQVLIDSILDTSVA